MRLFHYAACAVFVLGASAQAATFSETKLIDSDAEESDNFGISVGISGTTVIVGARQDNDQGTNSGAAYLFDAITGVELRQLGANDAAEFDSFGSSAAISNDRAIVGATGDNNNVGSAYVFDTASGAQLHKLVVSDGGLNDNFGQSVGISGTTAIVGIFQGVGGTPNTNGAAYLFDTVTGDLLFKLTAFDGVGKDYFGQSVGISGNRAIVGSFGDDDDGSSSGSAYVFDTVNGELVHKLVADDAEANDQFGASVAISGNLAIVGALGEDEAGSGSGAAYVFDITTGDQLFKLTASTPSENARFGRSVSISGTTAIVGAIQSSGVVDFRGSAHLFELVTGTEVYEFVASDAGTGDKFGGAVGVSGMVSVVGASSHDGTASNTGLAYVYAPEATAPVPLPAGVWLLGAGLGMILLTRRRRA